LAWTIEYADSAARQLKKLDRQTARRILDYMDDHAGKLQDPRSTGKALAGPLGGLWRYRIGDYRVICDIQDRALRILVVRVAHRSAAYE
jgi:mRNA interferase RelE/StbE